MKNQENEKKDQRGGFTREFSKGEFFRESGPKPVEAGIFAWSRRGTGGQKRIKSF